MSRILMVSAEASPFASTGGLGDVLQGLPKALVNAGHRVAVALPLYPRVRNFQPELVLQGLRFASANQRFTADVSQARRAGVSYLFLDVPELFNRPGIYGESDLDYPDNVLRYSAFCRGALALAHHVFNPDIIHCHDWPTALLPVMLAEHYQSQPAFMGLQTVLTIHNLAFQGPVSQSNSAALKLNGTFEQDHRSMLRSGIESATRITTVSPTYARDICLPAFGCGLEALLSRRDADLSGILNGIDTDLWDPRFDSYLPAHFSKDNVAGKSAVKAALLHEFGLPADRMDRPLVGVVARLAAQKGLDLLSQNPQQFLDLDASLIVTGDGNLQEEDFFRWFAAAHPTRVAAKIGFDTGQCHRIIAGSDVLLMPSRYEPCGLTQLYAMRYGTLPLVHATGGLKDTVTPDTGFSFETHSWRALLNCLREMTATWSTSKWLTMQQAAMAKDFSWGASAVQYSNLYAAMHHNGRDKHQSVREIMYGRR